MTFSTPPEDKDILSTENQQIAIFFLFEFGGPQLYNSEGLPFTYDQYVVIELVDKLYKSVTVCFLCESMNFHPDKQLFQVAGSGDRTTDPLITKTGLYVYTIGDPPVKVII